MWNFLVIIPTLLALVVIGAPVDDERYITTTSRYYLPTTTPTTSTTRHYLPAVTVQPPRPGSHNSGNRNDDRNYDRPDNRDDDRYNNQHNNKRPSFERDNRPPHLPPENEEWEKWKKMDADKKKEAWDKWSKVDSDSWQKIDENDKDAWDKWSTDKHKDPWNKAPTFLDDDDFSYYWFKLPYLHCPPYIRSDPVLFRHYFEDWWPLIYSKYELWRR